jgi:mycothiol synthase
MWVVAADNEAVATATARKTDQPNVGYVHFVATHPDHRGRRLGSAVTVAVLREFEARGATEAMLTTDDYRLAAIKTYLRLGFQPDCTHESHPERWREVFSSLSEEGFIKEERTH